jgi:hypothetical protein
MKQVKSYAQKHFERESRQSEKKHGANEDDPVPKKPRTAPAVVTPTAGQLAREHFESPSSEQFTALSPFNFDEPLVSPSTRMDIRSEFFCNETYENPRIQGFEIMTPINELQNDILRVLYAEADYNNQNEYKLLPNGGRLGHERGKLMRIRLKNFLTEHAGKRWWIGNLQENIVDAKKFIILLTFMSSEATWCSPSSPCNDEDIADILCIMRAATEIWFCIIFSLISPDGISLVDWERELGMMDDVHNMVLRIVRSGDAIKYPVVRQSCSV